MTIPFQQLDPEILDALIEEFVTRAGAIHGHADIAIGEIMAAVRDQLRNGTAEIVYDQDDQTWTILRKE